MTEPGVAPDPAATLVALRALVAVTTHDLANAIGVVGNYAALLSRTTGDPGVVDGLQRIRQSAGDAAMLAHGLAAVADRSLPGPGPVGTDLCAIVDEQLRRPAVTAAGPPVSFRPAHRPAQVAGDAVALGVVVRALVANALEASRPGGTVDVRIEDAPDGDGVRLTVEDSGTGLDAAAAERLFAPFDGARDGHAGIGLPATRQIVEHTGGRVRVAPRAGGRGTTVTVTLPFPAGDRG